MSQQLILEVQQSDLEIATQVIDLEVSVDSIVLEISQLGIQGPPGPPGVGGTQLSPSYPVAQPISALRVCALNNSNELVLADSATIAHAFRLIGLQQSAVSTGSAAPLVSGIVSDGSWVWDTLKPIWLGASGILTQVAPVSGFLVQVAFPITVNTINFEFQEITFL